MFKTKSGFLIVLLIIVTLFINCSDSDCPTCTDDPVIEEPNIINDLTTDLSDFSSTVLSWTTPDSALEYDIRYSLATITDNNWSSALQIDLEPSPQSYGTLEIFKIDRLDANTDYYFALKFRTDSTQWSELSNIVTCYTAEFDARNKILFSSKLDGDCEIYMINTDGTNLNKITSTFSNENAPEWMGTGNSILFNSDRDEKSQIYKMDYKGASQLRITDTSYYASIPKYNAVRNKILFYSFPDGSPRANIYTADYDGTNKMKISLYTDSLDFDGSWSPDGLQIVFVSYRDEAPSGGIYVMDHNGYNVVNLSSFGGYPSWSPDGLKIAFTSNVDGLYVMDADGTNVIRLTNHVGSDSHPSWSPDGSQIAFDSNVDGDYEIYTINADGTNLTQLTHNDVEDKFPAWSPVQ